MSTSHPPTTILSSSSVADASNDASRHESQSAPAASSAAELARAKISLAAALRNFPDFPIKGIDFVDIMPLFGNHELLSTLLRALELEVLAFTKGAVPDVVVGLDARGFLFGTLLAYKLGAGFAPVRKAGKLPGPVQKATYKKEYGEDVFEMQCDAVKPGQTVLIVDDIIATGGSAFAAGQLVEKLQGKTLGYLFILELDFLKGRDKLDAPVVTLLTDDVMGK